MVEMDVIKAWSSLGNCVLLVLKQYTYLHPASCTEGLETEITLGIYPFPSFPTL